MMSNAIGNINRMVPGLIEKLDVTGAEKAAAQVKTDTNFAELFSNMINSVNDTQLDASQIQEAFMSGEPVELHQLMIKAEEAGIAMDLLLEVRNKLLTAYNQIMQMPL
ncbi:MAG: flagellar hook-basal body complex protein FliE [Candidatus Zixiibacteriota bacterium]